MSDRRNGAAAVVAHGIVPGVPGIPGVHDLEVCRHPQRAGLPRVMPRHEQSAGYADSGPALYLSPGAPSGTEGADLGFLRGTKSATDAKGGLASSTRVSSPDGSAASSPLRLQPPPPRSRGPDARPRPSPVIVVAADNGGHREFHNGVVAADIEPFAVDLTEARPLSGGIRGGLGARAPRITRHGPRTTKEEAAMSEATRTVDQDDERVRVSTWTFLAAGASTGHHRHEMDYVAVPITGGLLMVTDASGATIERQQVAGVPYSGTAGTEHEVVSASDAPVVFVEVELKG